MRCAPVFLLLSSLPLVAAGADVYRSVDAQGHVQYSDVPSPGAQRLNDVLAESTSSNSSADSSKLQKQSQSISQRIATDAAARAAKADTEQVHAAQCKQATDAYQQSIAARRMYKLGPDGQRTYLSDDEAEQQRTTYRLAMEAACNNDSP